MLVHKITPSLVLSNILDLVLEDNDKELISYAGYINKYSSLTEMTELIKGLKELLLKEVLTFDCRTKLFEEHLEEDEMFLEESSFNLLKKVLVKLDKYQRKIFNIQFNEKEDFALDLLIDYNVKLRIKEFKNLSEDKRKDFIQEFKFKALEFEFKDQNKIDLLLKKLN